MKRKYSFYTRLNPSVLFGAFIMLFTTLTLAETNDPDVQNNNLAQASTAATLNNALNIKQAITRFTHKTAISDRSSQLAVYVSLNTTTEKIPSHISVEIKLDGTSLGQSDYEKKAIHALLNGASHKMLVNNIAPGSHDLIVHIKEKHGAQLISSHGAIRFNKPNQRKVFELSISLSDNDIPPEVVFLDHS